MDMVPNCVSEKAHAGDAHDGRYNLLLPVHILGRVVSILDIVVPVVRYTTPDLAKDYFSGYIIKRDFEANALSLGFVVP